MEDDRARLAPQHGVNPSMRPRHEAVEDGVLLYQTAGVHGPSMRPRHEAVEDGRVVRSGIVRYAPSMRPRHEAVEDSPERETPCRARRSFNEATARSRGRPTFTAGFAGVAVILQ